ncbi:hypothetical protein RND81_01G021200 [Saponaria officinalis]|uniref:Peptidase A1 domain-containing protein n=1 Tax=Saponaria officinalis TaxID=3572 RepID=A0AAW1NB16_SAPOF
MSTTKFNLHFLIFTLLCVFSKRSYSNNTTIIGGLRLTMIHIDSPNSRMYQPELSEVERANRLIDISNSRIYYLSKKTTNKNMSFDLKPDISNAPILNKYGFPYYVEIGIGTFPSEIITNTHAHANYLKFDIKGSSIWTQCKDCQTCFRQRSPRFQRSKSKTYHLVPCNECPKCRCEDDIALMVVSYGGGSLMRGSSDIITGSLGMNRSPYSLISQIGHLVKYRFSYCLQDYKNLANSTFLYFGNHIINRPNMFVTPILKRPNLFNYYVTINDIGVNGQKLNIPSHLFALKPDNSGGTVLDSDTAFNFLVPEAFDIVVESITNYISNNNLFLRERQGRDINLDACWEPLFKSPKVNLPTITYYLDNNAELLIQSTQLFWVYPADGVHEPGLYCLTIRRNEVHQLLNVLGASAQINQRLIFDILKSKLSFIAEDCTVEPLT